MDFDASLWVSLAVDLFVWDPDVEWTETGAEGWASMLVGIKSIREDLWER